MPEESLRQLEESVAVHDLTAKTTAREQLVTVPAQMIHQLMHAQIVVHQQRLHQLNLCLRETFIVQHKALEDVQMLQYISHLHVIGYSSVEGKKGLSITDCLDNLQCLEKGSRLVHVEEHLGADGDGRKIEPAHGGVITLHVHSSRTATVVRIEGLRHDNATDEHHQRDKHPHKVHNAIGVRVPYVLQAVNAARGTKVTPGTLQCTLQW